MTRDDIIRKLDALRTLEIMDPEAAAADADGLRIAALAAIDNGASDPQELAAAAMMTIDERVGAAIHADRQGIELQNKTGQFITGGFYELPVR